MVQRNPWPLVFTLYDVPPIVKKEIMTDLLRQVLDSPACGASEARRARSLGGCRAAYGRTYEDEFDEGPYEVRANIYWQPECATQRNHYRCLRLQSSLSHWRETTP